MIATLTSKGQVTLPKAIRDQLKLDAGTKLDFQVKPDGTLAIRPLTRSIDSIIGMAHRPGMKAATVKDMNDAIGDALAEKNERILRAARAQRRRSKKAA